MHKIAPSHWLVGSAGPASTTAEGVLTLIKTDYPEKIINFPPFRVHGILEAVFPRYFDVLFEYYPSLVDSWKSWALARMNKDTN
mmetsp:Transcript_5553/g.6526  ORF Transcript_5553/g.6526 Transcript_5553/m.6526 type:complete len:84 (-) Transcript_5553:720-971(-)